MQLRFAGFALAMMVAVISAACSSNSSTPDGAGGATANGAGGMCSGVTVCGGSVVGTWNVTSSCLRVEGQLDPQKFDAKCAAPAVTGSLQVTGSWSANAEGSLSDHTLTTGTEQFNLDKACLVISSTPTTCDGIAGLIKIIGYQSVTCTPVASGCACTATVHQQGGLGIVVASPDATNYTTSNNTLTVSEDSGDIKYGYCAQGNTLTVSPQGSIPNVTGTIVLQKDENSGSGGSGGTTGSGGQTGASGNGGGTGLGGTSSGGASAAGAGGATGASGAAGSAGAAGNAGNGGPCDIYKSGGTPCVAAHSPVRALSADYGGKLYQLRNSAGTTKDINAVAPGGIADSAAQTAFCTGTTCLITVIYDQTGHGLDLTYEGNGSPLGGLSNVQPASATKEPIKLAGNTAYGLWLDGGKAYWVDGSKKGMPLGKEPEAMYMVTSGTHSGGGCCFDYGNAGTGRVYAGPGTMDALNFSSTTLWGKGAGAGPWVMADLEGGLYAENDKLANPKAPTQTTPFVTAMLKNNGTSEFAIRSGNAASGALGTSYKGALPNGYNPMKKQGAIVLGSGGDCCKTNMNLAVGTFYEGCIVSGYPSDATEDAVQANILAAKYSK